MVNNTDASDCKSTAPSLRNEGKKPDSKSYVLKSSTDKLCEAADLKSCSSRGSKRSVKTLSKQEQGDSNEIKPNDVVDDNPLKNDDTTSNPEDQNPKNESQNTGADESLNTVAEVSNTGGQKEIPEDIKTSDTAFVGGKNTGSQSKVGRYRIESGGKRPSEIPKLKSLPKAIANGTHQKPIGSFQSKLPVKMVEKEIEQKNSQEAIDSNGSKTISVKTFVKAEKPKKSNDRVKRAMAEDFGYIVPLYEKQFKKISDVWVNTIYCSLTMRTNLVKLLFQAFPNINRAQFYTEDERLLHCIAHAKSSSKLEAENLLKFLKNLVVSRNKTKDDYGMLLANKEIADSYNHDWRKLIRKVTDLGEEVKLLQMETPEVQKKKEASEISINEKIRRMELNLLKKDEEIKKLANQLHVLRMKETAYKENALLKIPDYKEIKADVNSLLTTQKEFDELKAKYLFQNYAYEKKIKDLENLLKDKKRVLEKERDVKKQLQGLLIQLQAHQKRLTTTIGKEQVDYVMGRSLQDRAKRREQLWVAAAKLVLRGFLIQMKKLERDRNKMLLELQTSDLENTSDLTAIIQKDNFIKSIKQQMNELQKVCANVKAVPPKVEGIPI